MIHDVVFVKTTADTINTKFLIFHFLIILNFKKSAIVKLKFLIISFYSIFFKVFLFQNMKLNFMITKLTKNIIAKFHNNP